MMAIKDDGECLKHASMKLRDNGEIVATAVKNNAMSLRLAGTEQTKSW